MWSQRNVQTKWIPVDEFHRRISLSKCNPFSTPQNAPLENRVAAEMKIDEKSTNADATDLEVRRMHRSGSRGYISKCVR